MLSPHGDESPVQLLRWRPVELIQSPFLLVSFRDLSPEERALVQQQRFMTDLTHELRTPLAIVSGNLQRMARLRALPEAVSSRLTMAREEMARIQSCSGISRCSHAWRWFQRWSAVATISWCRCFSAGMKPLGSWRRVSS